MRVTFYQRRPQSGDFSIERLFNDIRKALPKNIHKEVKISHFHSKGFFRRVYNIFEAPFFQGDINHITGDVHFLTIFLSKKKTLLTIHDLVSVHRLYGWQRKIFFFFWYWLPLKRVAMVTVISESTKIELLKYVKISPGKIRVIYNCISDIFKPFQKEFNNVKPVILQIGTGSNKNIDRVIAALQGICCHLRIIGSLNEEQLSSLDAKKIEFSYDTNISDEKVYEEYCQCDVLIFVSTYEGFGLPIIEAQATGRPVITSNILSMAEVAGNTACLVDPFNVKSIKKGIHRIISDSTYREKLVKEGLKNAGRFEATKIAQSYSSIYHSIINK